MSGKMRAALCQFSYEVMKIRFGENVAYDFLFNTALLHGSPRLLFAVKYRMLNNAKCILAAETYALIH